MSWLDEYVICFHDWQSLFQLVLYGCLRLGKVMNYSDYVDSLPGFPLDPGRVEDCTYEALGYTLPPYHKLMSDQKLYLASGQYHNDRGNQRYHLLSLDAREGKPILRTNTDELLANGIKTTEFKTDVYYQQSVAANKFAGRGDHPSLYHQLKNLYTV